MKKRIFLIALLGCLTFSQALYIPVYAATIKIQQPPEVMMVLVVEEAIQEEKQALMYQQNINKRQDI